MDLVETLNTQRERDDKVKVGLLPEFVKLAGRVGADFEVQVETAEQLRVLLLAIGGHNEYDPQRVADRLGPLVGDCMQVRVHQFTAGPALYFQVPYTEQQQLKNRYGGLAVWLGDEWRREFAQRLLDIGAELKADERSVRQNPTTGPDGAPLVVWKAPGDRPYEVRLWWD